MGLPSFIIQAVVAPVDQLVFFAHSRHSWDRLASPAYSPGTPVHYKSMAASSEDWSEEELRLEKEHFKKIVNAYLYYK